MIFFQPLTLTLLSYLCLKFSSVPITTGIKTLTLKLALQIFHEILDEHRRQNHASNQEQSDTTFWQQHPAKFTLVKTSKPPWPASIQAQLLPAALSSSSLLQSQPSNVRRQQSLQ